MTVGDNGGLHSLSLNGSFSPAERKKTKVSSSTVS